MRSLRPRGRRPLGPRCFSCGGVAAVLLLLLPACSVGDELARRSAGVRGGTEAAPRVPAAPPDVRERDWLLRLSEWLPAAAWGGVGKAVCVRDLRTTVGDAPTRRLERLERLARRLCGGLEEARASQRRRLAERLLEAMDVYERAGSDRRPLPAIAGFSDRSRVEPRLGRALTELTGKPTEVRCWSHADWKVVTEEWPHAELDGYARGDERVHVANGACAPLVALYRGRLPTDAEARLRLAWALNVLAHEAEHRAGVGSEAAAQCYAMQKIRRLARSLGAPAALAGALAQLMWSQLYETMPSAYRSAQCRAGGRLDLHPSSGRWP
jgi:hypothetical protein